MSFARRCYHSDPVGTTFGLASRALRRLVPAYLVANIVTVLARYASWYLDGRYWPFSPTDWTLGGVFTPTEVVGAWWWFVAMHHYYLDRKIWRMSRDPAVQRGLGLQPRMGPNLQAVPVPVPENSKAGHTRRASQACMGCGEGGVRPRAEKGARCRVPGLLRSAIHASAVGVTCARLTPDACSAMILSSYKF